MRQRRILPDIVIGCEWGRLYHARSQGQATFEFATRESLCFVPTECLTTEGNFNETTFNESAAPQINHVGNPHVGAMMVFT